MYNKKNGKINNYIFPIVFCYNFLICYERCQQNAIQQLKFICKRLEGLLSLAKIFSLIFPRVRWPDIAILRGVALRGDCAQNCGPIGKLPPLELGTYDPGARPDTRSTNLDW